MGIKAIGATFARMCTAAGYHVFDEAEYPSLIRGGHNTHQVVASTVAVHAGREKIDVLVALNDETITRHIQELFPKGGIVFDQARSKIDLQTQRRDVTFYDVPLGELAAQYGGDLMRNTVSLGATAALFDTDFRLLTEALKITFKGKSVEVLKQNALAAQSGYEYVRKKYPQHVPWKLIRQPAESSLTHRHLYLTGNDALALGALRGGMSFYAAYPMTPTSALLEFFAEHAPRFGLVVKHAEDEIAVINMAIGASYTGVRSMIATSGGGFSLMVEALGLAAMTETPLVINLGQRPGPATGLPTWTEQGDLLFALHAAQGDFPRFIVAPGDVEECFTETVRAFNLAQKYEVPVIILTDKYIAESHHDTPEFSLEEAAVMPPPAFTPISSNAPYERYNLHSAQSSIRPLPGTKGGIYVANSDEHDEVGYSEEDATIRTAMMQRRMRKLSDFEKELPQPVVEGDSHAHVNILCWGSTKGPVRDAIRLLAEKKIAANFLNITWMYPFPEAAVAEFVHNAHHLVLVENNYTGQFGSLVQLHTGKKIPYRLLKYSGRQFYPEEIVRKIEEIVTHA